MNGSLRSALALVLTVALPIAALADNHNNRGSGSAPSRPAARNQGSAPSRPPAPPVVHQGGFSLPHDVNARPVQVQRTVVRPMTGNEVNRGNEGNRGTESHVQSSSRGVSGGPYRGRFNGPVVRNPRNWEGWGWNHGVAWYPASIYWGGGFWGAWAIDNLAAAILFGSIADYQDQAIYPSYEVEPDSPGATLLENYGLQQTQCGPPNLVVIWGPDNSVICAYPNNLVAPGNYQLDPTDLTITSSS